MWLTETVEPGTGRELVMMLKGKVGTWDAEVILEADKRKEGVSRLFCIFF